MIQDSAQKHQRTVAYYGFTDTVLTADDLASIFHAGLDETEAYGVECDIQCGAFDTVSEAIKYYTQQECEG